MNYKDLIAINPDFEKFVTSVPEKIANNFNLIHKKSHSIIHQQDENLKSMGFVLDGKIKITSELDNGSIYLIEENQAICFISEVAFLSGHTTSSVTIECLTDCIIAYISKDDFYYWIDNDINFLKLMCTDVAEKLYYSSYNKGEYFFYPTKYTLLKYIKKHIDSVLDNNSFNTVKINKTRQQISEELGIPLKTLNRLIYSFRDLELINISKGKIEITAKQYACLPSYLEKFKQQSKNGFKI